MAEDVIAVEALRKEYFEIVAVNDVDLSVPSGEIFGLIGPNGAGKTTMLRMIATTLEPTSGRILFEGRDIWRDPKAIRMKMGFMPDFFQLYGRLKVWELLTYFAKAHGISGGKLSARVNEVLTLIDLSEKRETFVKGLSRGMTQRLGLGRAILHHPSLLLLDEPASGLDPLARRRLFDVLREIHARGTTILISSHILGELSDLCTSVGIMHNGRFLETGSTDEIVRKIMPRRQISIRVVGPAEPARKIIAEFQGVGDLREENSQLQFSFDGDNEKLAELNGQLVRAGIAVALLEEKRTDLHELYFAIAERDADAAS